MSLCCECCVLSGRGVCDGLITRPEEFYRVWCIWVWSWSLEKWGYLGPQRAVEPLKKKKPYIILITLCKSRFRIKNSLFLPTDVEKSAGWNILTLKEIRVLLNPEVLILTVPQYCVLNLDYVNNDHNLSHCYLKIHVNIILYICNAFRNASLLPVFHFIITLTFIFWIMCPAYPSHHALHLINAVISDEQHNVRLSSTARRSITAIPKYCHVDTRYTDNSINMMCKLSIWRAIRQ
jgi:hypothetical protein